jgi:SNF2 family DNA or RNA helicase
VVEGIKAGLDKHFKGEKRFEVFNGAVPGDKRGQLAEEYEAGKIDALVCNIQAAGVNLTLVRGSHAVFAQEPWSPGELEQARARIRRIGQTKFCVYHTLLVEKSLDEAVHDSLRSKRKGASDFDKEYARRTIK